jgi:2-desacetyl-2-hydroxyethyl bacteriochlorophyllide A dehydrogenase
MRQIILEEPFRFTLREVEDPVRGAGEALVRVRRIGICGTDLHAFRGRQPYFSYPRVLGHELSVEVMEIGENAAGLKAGDACVPLPYLSCGTCVACRRGKTNCCVRMRVLGVHQDGGMQEYLSLPADLLIRADGLSLEQMALVENQAIGAHAVRRAAIEPGEYALVVGAGPIGLGVIQFAKAAGAEVIAMDIDEGRLRFCQEQLGVEQIIDARGDAIAHLEEITSGELPTVVFDATGNPQSMMNAFRYMAHGGRYVLVSLVEADITFYDPDFHRRETTLLSSRNATRQDFENVIHAMQTGLIRTDPLVTHRVPLEEMIGEFESWLKPETRVVKAMVEA